MTENAEVPIYTDPVVRDFLQSRISPQGWHQRSLYFTPAGGKAWLEAAKASPIGCPDHILRLREVASNVPVSTYVSLGPGDGRVDLEVVAALQNNFNGVTYIPIDINLDLLQFAINTLRSQTLIPFGVITDFESRLSFLEGVIHDSHTDIHPILVGLIGGTFGNLDLLESSFIAQVAGITKPGDYLMFDAVVKCHPHANDMTKIPIQKPDTALHFLATGAANQIDCSIEEVLANYECMSLTRGNSDVQGAEVTQVIYRHQNRNSVNVLRYCKYQFEGLLDWVRSIGDFVPVWEESLKPYNGETGFGAILLRRQ